MENIILLLQTVAMEWIAENHLEAEYNKYWISQKSYYPMPFQLIDFAIGWYMEHSQDF